ncbi:hypothetical protein DOJK_02441 [Patescibacteria group bacterium]|nr:hypothetical protein DOJK_02441 [Patescibacteria group bacterium]
MSTKEELYKKYPWLEVTTTMVDYVKPSYYDKIIKEYEYKGKSDLDYTIDFLKDQTRKDLSVVEFGAGTGRGTKLIMENIDFDKLTLVDLSPQMMETLKELFSKDSRVQFAQSDHLNFMESTEDVFDLMVTLWSLSHSIHQHFGRNKGDDTKIVQILKKFFTNNISKEGKAFIIHFDTLSDEQRILTKQWAKVYPTFADYYHNKIQSPSKQIVDKVLNQLNESNTISYNCEHIIGDEIIYKDMNEALEVFMNFHLESHFNQLDIVEEVVEDLTNELNKYKDEDGTIRVKPGFFLYTITR